MELEKSLFNKNGSYEWTIKPNLVSDIYKMYTISKKQWFIFIVLLIPLQYLQNNLIDESRFVESFFVMIIMTLCFYMFVAKPFKMFILTSISQTRYRIDNNGININKLNTNEDKYYSWDDLKCFNYNREKRKSPLTNIIANDCFLITVIDNKMHGMFVRVPSNLIDDVDSLLSNHIPFQYVSVKFNRVDYLFLMILLVPIFYLALIYIMGIIKNF